MRKTAASEHSLHLYRNRIVEENLQCLTTRTQKHTTQVSP